MANKYSYQNVGRIEFTEEDIAGAIESLSREDRHKSVAHLDVNFTRGKAVRLFSELCEFLDGFVKTDYSGLTIQRPKDDRELREAALYDLRYRDKHADLRDLRAQESGVEPEPEQE